jgi:hypothetical protein
MLQLFHNFPFFRSLRPLQKTLCFTALHQACSHAIDQFFAVTEAAWQA